MQSYTQTVGKAGDAVISAVEKAQGAYVSAISTVSKTIGGYLPELPQLPLVKALPTPAEVVTTTFDLWEQALKSQKRYAKELVKAVSPVTEKVMPATNGRKTAAKA